MSIVEGTLCLQCLLEREGRVYSVYSREKVVFNGEARSSILERKGRLYWRGKVVFTWWQPAEVELVGEAEERSLAGDVEVRGGPVEGDLDDVDDHTDEECGDDDDDIDNANNAAAAAADWDDDDDVDDDDDSDDGLNLNINLNIKDDLAPLLGPLGVEAVPLAVVNSPEIRKYATRNPSGS